MGAGLGKVARIVGQYEPTGSELKASLLGIAALNWSVNNDSSSRIQMFASHVGQMLVVTGGEPRRIQSGAEAEFAKTTFNVKVPSNSEIIRVIRRYPRGVGRDAIKHSPYGIIVIEDVDTKEVGMIELDHHHCLHQHFGFEYKENEAVMRKIASGSRDLRGGTVLLNSPSVDDGGNYNYGVELNVMCASIPGVIEDGVIVNRDALPKMRSKGYERIVFSFGKKWYPLDVNWDPSRPDEYKPMPDIGDPIRLDGLIVALRKHDDRLAPVKMTPEALRKVDYTFDKKIYTSPIAKPNARVVDIIVHHDRHNPYPPTPSGMEVQFQKYETAMSTFYKEVIEVYEQLHAQRKERLKLSRPFHRLVVEAMSDTGVTPYRKADKVTRTYRSAPLDDWRVEIVYEFDVYPDIGSKITDCHGGKSIICSIWPGDRMPRDEHGNVADVIVDSDSKIKRMNLGGLYEQYINASGRDQMQRWMLERYGVLDKRPATTNEAAALIVRDPAALEECNSRILDFYALTTPRMHEMIINWSGYDPVKHVAEIMVNGVYIQKEPDCPKSLADVVRDLRVRYPALRKPVVYTDPSGVTFQTKRNFIIGSVYYIVLEKTGGSWSGVSSAKLSHYGVPTKLTEADKRSAPGRLAPIKILGESEERLWVAVMPGEIVADVADRSNNPAAHRMVYRSVLSAEHPTAIPNAMDREAIPLGKMRPLAFINHFLRCFGVEYYSK